MRSADSRSSSARPWAVSVAATQFSAAPVPGPARRATSCSHARSTPAVASGSASAPGLAHVELLERLEHLVLGVGGVERPEGAALGGGPHGLALQGHELLGLRALDARLDEPPDDRPEHLEGLGQIGCRALGRRGGVVELVGQAGGHRAQRGQALAVLLDRRDTRHDRAELAHDPAVHGALGEHQVEEGVRGDQREQARGLALDAHAVVVLAQQRDRAQPGRCDLRAHGLDAPFLDARGAQRALEQQVEAGRRLACLGDDVAGLGRAHLRHVDPALQLVVGEVVEQVDRAQVGDGERGGAHGPHACARYSWMSETAIEPSPTALATRLIERARTSPATKTPGTLVSST